jgi:hypothetical protein
MGGSQSTSTVKQENNQMIINKQSVSVINKQINNFIANAIVYEAKACSSSLFQNQRVIIKNLKAAGDINIGVEQTQGALVDFNCLQTSTVRNDIANQMIHEMMANLESSNSANVLNKLNAIAGSKAESQFTPNPFQSSSSNSNVQQIQNFKSETNLNKNIENVVKNSVAANFTSTNIDTCKASVIANQSIEVINAQTNAKITIAIQQQQAIQIITKCVQTADIGNQITNDILGTLGVKTADSTSTEVESSFSGSAESSALNKGVFESLGSFIGGIFAPLLGLLSGLFSGLLGPFAGILAPITALLGPVAGTSVSSSTSSYCCSICLCIIVIIMFIIGVGRTATSSSPAPTSPTD